MVELVSDYHHPINPLDLLEELGTANDWTLDRHSESELLIERGGPWCEYHKYSVWQADDRSMFLSCHFDMHVPVARRLEAFDLAAHANERLRRGQCDPLEEGDAAMLRHTIPPRRPT